MGEPQAPQPLLSFWRDSVPAAWRVLPSLLVYESVWKFLTWMIIGPLGVTLLHAVIRLGGDVAVANNQLVAFALSPLGGSTLLVMATASLAITFIERAGLYYLLLNALYRRRPTSWHAFGQMLRAAPRVAGVALLQVGLFLLMLIPFAAALWLAYTLLVSEWDINYYLADRPWQLLLAGGLAVAIGLIGVAGAAFLYVRWAFAVPACVFEDRRLTGALRASAVLVKGGGWRVLGAVLCWELFRYVLYWLVLLALKGLNEAVLRGLEHASSGVLGWVAAVMILDMLVFAAVAIVETIAYCLVITLLYENLHRRRAAQRAVPPADPPLRRLDGATDPLSRRVVLASALVLLLIIGMTGWRTTAVAQGFTERHTIYVTAHRAGAKDAPENTLAALRHAIAVGADYAEIDVQRTRDGVIVVLHDRDLKRLTGDGRKIWDVTYAEVGKLYYRSAKGKPAPAPEDGKIATLEEFIDTAIEGKIKLNIELKYYAEHFDHGLAKEVVDLLERRAFVGQCVITSLEPSALKGVRKLNKNLPTGVIVAADLGDITRYDMVTFLSLKRQKINAVLRRLASSHDLEIHAWDVETRADMELMIHLGADNLITDDPALAIEVRRWYEGLSDVELILFNFRTWLRS